MEAPTPDPNKLLQTWMEWERGEVTPGRVMANMKTAGLRQLLEQLSGPGGPPSATGTTEPGAAPEPGATPEPEGEARPVGGPPSTWAPIV